MSEIKPIEDGNGDVIGRAHRIDETVVDDYFTNENGEGRVILETPDDYTYWHEPEPIEGLTWLDENVLGVLYARE